MDKIHRKDLRDVNISLTGANRFKFYPEYSWNFDCFIDIFSGKFKLRTLTCVLPREYYDMIYSRETFELDCLGYSLTIANYIREKGFNVTVLNDSVDRIRNHIVFMREYLEEYMETPVQSYATRGFFNLNKKVHLRRK